MKRVSLVIACLFALVLLAPIRTSYACGSDSDCKVGKCSGGKCGSCGSDSDCKGHSKCSSGKCNSCGSDSDCAVGKCSSGKCGSCGSDSDCKGGTCSGGKCSNRDNYQKG